MWPFSRKPKPSQPIEPALVEFRDGVAYIDVRGQTCPGYLLAINRAVDPLSPGTRARLIVSYPPSGEDVRSWCNVKGLSFLGVEPEEDRWIIEIRR